MDLASEISQALEQYSAEVEEAIKQACQDKAKEAAKLLKETSPKDRGRYAKSWTVKRVNNSQGSISLRVFNKDHYRLTHLLEKGHATRDGGRTKKIVHIKPVEDQIVGELEREINRIIENGGKQ